MVDQKVPTAGEDRHIPFAKKLRRLRSPGGVIALFLLALFVHLLGRHIIRLELQRLYTPPALTAREASTYARFIRLAQAHPEYERIFLNDVGTLEFKQSGSTEAPHSKGSFSGAEVCELVKLARDLRWANCVWAEKNGTCVTFVHRTTYILPMRPGVLYSLDGRNPNELPDGLIEKNRPYTLIGGNWYTSKGLVISPTMPGHAWRLPERSLIDHSSQGKNAVASEILEGNRGQPPIK
jgi:hypothetical protein